MPHLVSSAQRPRKRTHNFAAATLTRPMPLHGAGEGPDHCNDRDRDDKLHATFLRSKARALDWKPTFNSFFKREGSHQIHEESFIEKRLVHRRMRRLWKRAF